MLRSWKEQWHKNHLMVLMLDNLSSFFFVNTRAEGWFIYTCKVGLDVGTIT
jgi:hypothetical protein